LKAHLFIPCLMENFHPQAAEATVRVLRRLGIQLTYPEGQTCCGQPLYKAGRRRQAVRLARRFLELFEGSEAVVAPSGSCVSMVRNHYPELFRDEPRWHDRSLELGGRVYELTEFLVRVVGVEDVGASWEGRAVYHDSCQVSRALKIRQEPRALLSHVRGLELVEMDQAEVCCGFGGLFSFQFPEISEVMVREKAAHILATQAQLLISAEISCLMNMEGYLKRHGHTVRAAHIAEVLAHTA
jgi:L-lactate dehydrogenase complex protein LldE